MKMKPLIKLIACCLCILLHVQAYAQKTPGNDFFEAVKKYNCSTLWKADSVLNLGVVDDSLYFDPRKFEFPEPLGYVGGNFQRFYIHFTEVVKDKTHPEIYHVAGKTKVRDNICSFTGSFVIERASLTKEAGLPQPVRRRGTIECSCTLYEDSADAGSGIIEGRMTTGFCIYNNVIVYDNVHGVSDGFCNNQFTGTWVSYRGGQRKICNWGDHRIPASKGFDIGAGEFSPAGEFLKYGWQSYADCNSSDSKIAKEARKLEERKWWLTGNN